MKTLHLVSIDDLYSRFSQFADTLCLIDTEGNQFSYQDLISACEHWSNVISRCDVKSGDVIAFSADYSLHSLAFIIAAWANANTVALMPKSLSNDEKYIQAATANWVLDLGIDSVKYLIKITDKIEYHSILKQLKEEEEPGLIIFTSGSSGEPKAAVHKVQRLLSKFYKLGKPYRTLAFLVFDHIAGIDTAFYTLMAGGTLVLSKKRDPDTVCALIEACQVEVLPTSPSFLRLMLSTNAYQDYDLSSLRIVTYGAEPMDDTTLSLLEEKLPGPHIIQKYGTTEFGSPRTVSRDRNSRWIHFKSDEIDIKVDQNNILWVRSSTSILGYLNYPSPLDNEGWICTGDLVEKDGEWIKILGRQDEIINVGGEKVIPVDVKKEIIKLDFVLEVSVIGEQHPLLGQIVVALIKLAKGKNCEDAEREIRRYCMKNLPRHMVPMKINFVGYSLYNNRYKEITKKI